MREKKWTPGPWLVVDGNYPSFQEIEGPSFKISVVMCASDLDEDDYIRRDADLSLIAAAPDLVEALEGLARMHRERFGLDGAYDSEIRIAETALAKAYGEK